LTVFWLWIAWMTSPTVMLSFASWSGLTQYRIAYWPAPKTAALAMPGTRVSWSLMLM
jgi:hypothetical protein